MRSESRMMSSRLCSGKRASADAEAGKPMPMQKPSSWSRALHSLYRDAERAAGGGAPPPTPPRARRRWSGGGAGGGGGGRSAGGATPPAARLTATRVDAVGGGNARPGRDLVALRHEAFLQRRQHDENAVWPRIVPHDADAPDLAL